MIRLCIGVRKECQTMLDSGGVYERTLATMEALTRKLVGGNVCEAIERVDVGR